MTRTPATPAPTGPAAGADAAPSPGDAPTAPFRSVYEATVRDRHHAAAEAYVSAAAGVRWHMEHDSDGLTMADAIRHMAMARAVAEWWDTAIKKIDDHGHPAVEAVATTRTAARESLVELVTPSHRDPIRQGFAVIETEGARLFYRDTAELTTPTALRWVVMSADADAAPDVTA
ncbi:hypothetical protein ACFVH6_23675 [Spirillospora sp. NPDC127200]